SVRARRRAAQHSPPSSARREPPRLWRPTRRAPQKLGTRQHPPGIVVVTSVPGVASVTALPGSVCRLLGRRTDPITCTLDVIMSARALPRQRRTGAEMQLDPTMSDAEYPPGVFRW